MGLIQKISEDNLDAWYRWLTILAIALPVAGAALGGFSGYAAYLVGDRTSTIKDAAISKLQASRQPRLLSDEQKVKLAECLPKGPKGHVVITVLSTESDAPVFAAEIAEVLKKAGNTVDISNKIWIRLKLDGTYMVSGLPDTSPQHGIYIQNCFREANIRVRGLNDPLFYTEFEPPVPADNIIMVISNRE